MPDFNRDHVIDLLGAAAARLLRLPGASGLTAEQQGAQGIREIFDRDPEIDPLLAIVAYSVRPSAISEEQAQALVQYGRWLRSRRAG